MCASIIACSSTSGRVETTQCFKSLMCAERVCLLFLFHRHDDVTPSWFRALESHVLRVPNGNGMKSVLHHLLYLHHLCWFVFWLLHEAAFLFSSFLSNDIGSGAQLTCTW